VKWGRFVTKLVLIADDNVVVRRALRQVFQYESDFEVCAEAGNGREAVELVEEYKPDLVVLDLSMPIMNGLDAARAIKRVLPEVPVILFSNYSDKFSEQEARSAGISAMVSKTESVAVLVTKARLLVNQLAA
jgi:DNA-binding NarL/FixJ family response regulator